jgi:SAM-dependent methyltransferase
VWSNPRPSEDEIRRYYSSEYRLDYKGRSTPSLRHVARSGRGALNRYRALAPDLKHGDRILDAGAGGGEVVYVLRRLGFDASGIEPDAEYAQHARLTLGVPIETGFVQDLSYPAGRFDVVTMYHSLEHVEDPVAILSRLRSWTVDGGLLVVEVPNVEARCIAPAHRFHVAHFYSFNRETLEAVGKLAGFRPDRTVTSPDGGNLITTFRANRAAARPEVDPANYVRVVAALKTHTPLRYYGSLFPYVGPLQRLRTYILDRRTARGRQNAQAVLDELVERSELHQ